MRLYIPLLAVLGIYGAEVRVYDSGGILLRNARIAEISPTEYRITAPGFAPKTIPKTTGVAFLTQVTVTATPGLAEEIMVRPEMILTGDRPTESTVAHTFETQPNIALQQTGPARFLRSSAVSPAIRYSISSTASASTTPPSVPARINTSPMSNPAKLRMSRRCSALVAHNTVATDSVELSKS